MGKQQDAVAEMSEQIDQLGKMKAKIEKDKNQIMAEIADVRAATDEVGRSKASAEKTLRNLTANLNDLNKKVEECNLNLGDMEQAKRRLTAENADLLRQLQELENNATLLVKTNRCKSEGGQETLPDGQWMMKPFLLLTTNKFIFSLSNLALNSY